MTIFLKNNSLKFLKYTKFLLLIFFASGCGSGNNNEPILINNYSYANQWLEDIFLPEINYKNKCINPRIGTNPETNNTYADVQGTYIDENNFLRSFSNNTYLWYNEIIDADPSLHSVENYFALLKAPHDRFHFTYPTEEWLQISQSGVTTGYGAIWINLSNRIFVAYTEPNSPATDIAINIERGDEVIEIDGINVNDAENSGQVSNALYPPTPNQTHTFLIKKRNSKDNQLVTMTSANITSSPVQSVKTIKTDTGNVGYFLFNDHIATSEKSIFDAITQLKSNNIVDLILDLRYNSGGYLAIANQLTYMIAGPTYTAGKSFETMKFNDKHLATNPITNEPIQAIPFYTKTIGLSSMDSNTDLPFLNLNLGENGYPRVFILTGNDTCSASESIINSLLGINIEVIQIGSVTCGKPYGFYPMDNCGTTYFTIQFKGINSIGFGDYSDGFKPRTSSLEANMPLGCIVEEDVQKLLGSIDENRFSAALHYRNTGSCPNNSLSRSIMNINSTNNKYKKINKLKKNIFLSNKIL